MKTAIIYTSKTGFTERYAKWLAESLEGDLFKLKEVQKKDAGFFAGYDAIIYAGWCMAGKVVKANWFLEKASGWKDKGLAIVAVGASPNEHPEVQVALHNLLTDEQRTYIRAFYCQGGINYDKMGAPSRFAMKAFAKSLDKKDATPDEKRMAEMISHSYDIADKKYIEPVVEYLDSAIVARKTTA